MAIRGRLEIIRDLLEIIGIEDLPPTQLMYKSRLAWHQMTRYLQELMAKELITDNVESVRVRGRKLQRGAGRSRRRYRVTTKGRELLKTINHALALLGKCNQA